MIGTGQDLAQARSAAAANHAVSWRDWVPAAELPAIVAGHDVCLGIFGTGEKALRVVPNKVFQGAAAGCAIVTSDTAPQRRALREACAQCQNAASPVQATGCSAPRELRCTVDGQTGLGGRGHGERQPRGLRFRPR